MIFLKKFFPWGMWALAVSFFTYQFVLRLYPGLIIENISLKFQLDATSFGFLSSLYYYGYASFQIPVAIFLDRYGPRYIIAFCIFLCSISLILFSYTQNWPLLLLSRFLMGATSAVGFLGTSKVISLWFDKSAYAKMVGFSFSIGLLGAFYGGRPLSHLVAYLGWQQTSLLLFLLGSFLACLIFFFLQSPKDVPNTASSVPAPFRMEDFKKLLKNKKIGALAFANLLMVGVLEGFADVWSIPYLMKTYEYSKPEAAFAASFIYIGMIVGAPFLGFCATRFKAYYELTSLSGFLSALLIGSLLFYHGSISYAPLCFMLFLAGILCCYQILIFAIGSNLVPLSLMGITIAFLNCINMLGGSFFHTFIGRLLDYFWDGTFDKGIPSYCALTYAKALWVIPLASLLGAFIILLIRPRSFSSKA